MILNVIAVVREDEVIEFDGSWGAVAVARTFVGDDFR